MTTYKSLATMLLAFTLIGWMGCAQDAQPVAEATGDHMEAGEDVPLSAEDQALVDAQKICPVGKSPLGGMGTPVKVMVEGQPIFICCEHCREPLLKDPAKYLAVLEDAKAETSQDDAEPKPSSKGLAAPTL